jgi:hypothetical protein
MLGTRKGTLGLDEGQAKQAERVVAITALPGFGGAIDGRLLQNAMAEPGPTQAPPAPPLEIPALIHQLWAELDQLQGETTQLNDRLASVSAPRPGDCGKESSNLKTQTGIGSELAGMVCLLDGQIQRLRDMRAALQI